MKKIILLFLILMPVISYSQWKSFSFKVGYYTPYDLKSGFIYGIDYGTVLNENITFLLSGDLYYKSIRNDSYLGSSEKLGVKVREGQRLDEWVGWHLPITAKIRVEFPVNESSISPFITGGIGYSVTRVSIEEFDTQSLNSETSSLSYHGFVWQLGGGIFYRIGRSSSIILELLHNSAIFEKEEQFNYFSRLNSSGVIFRIGIDFGFF